MRTASAGMGGAQLIEEEAPNRRRFGSVLIRSRM
jgi:hypothetical protein